MFWLFNLNITGRAGTHHIRTGAGTIKAVSGRLPSIPRESDARQIYFEDAMAFPGLINSHDHLDFSLFPTIGNKSYADYVEWGADIHTQNKALIQSITNIPRPLSVQYGMYKSLLAGVTTVVHHGSPVDTQDALINIRQDEQSIHSVLRGKNWRWQLNNPRNSKLPVVIHIGEGTDMRVKKEIDTLLRWNLWKRPLIGVHGIAMKESQAARFRALVWCPLSNNFLYGQTAAVEKLAQHTTLLFGSDSTLTGSWNFWDHLRFARNTKKVSDEQLFNMVTAQAADSWKINTGKIEQGRNADIVIAKSRTNTWDAFYNLNPRDLLLVLRKGEPELFDASLLGQMEKFSPADNFEKVYIDGVAKFVRGNLQGLIAEIHKYNNNLQFPFTF